MRIFFWFHYLFIFLPWEIFKSSLAVSYAVLFPKRSVKPGIIALPIDLQTDWGIVMLANSISLTPGTLSLDVSQDKKTLFVHCLALEDPDQFKKVLKQVFEKKILRLEGKST